MTKDKHCAWYVVLGSDGYTVLYRAISRARRDAWIVANNYK